MAKLLTLGSYSTQEEVESQYKSWKKHDRERLLAVLMAYEKNTLCHHIGATLRRGGATIARWPKVYREGGVKQLLQRKHGGSSDSLSKTNQELQFSCKGG